MKKIKFRVWTGKDMIYFDFKDLVKPLFSVRELILKNSDKVSQQFTGLLDKNGKEIYEGDIVEYQHEMYEEMQTNIIAWDSDRLGFYPFCEDESYSSYINQNTIEVIGNIYENPESIK